MGFSGEHHLFGRPHIVGGQLDGDRGIGHCLERREPLRKEVQRQRVRDEDLHHRRRCSGDLLHLAAAVLDVAQNGFGDDGEALAGGGQYHLMRAAVDEFHADPFFERADAATESRLRDAASRRRAREISGEYQGAEILKPCQFHHPCSFGREWTCKAGRACAYPSPSAWNDPYCALAPLCSDWQIASIAGITVLSGAGGGDRASFRGFWTWVSTFCGGNGQAAAIARWC